MIRIPADQRQELRLAVVMTGGVSLAVWMGGVAHEINRLVRGDEPVYSALLDLTGADARVDVISGTSAGGLNGALLATARARGADTELLRRLWMETGALDRLLRPATEPDPPSLLRGDYFREEIVRALEQLQGDPPAPDRAPLHLTITGTLLSGVHRGFPDDFGAVVRDLEHRARFTFVRTPERDDFATRAALERLALAARSSASFPVAFEPVHVPIGGGGDSDMEDVANFAVSRWLVDGGVLVNKPIDAALDAIFAQPAGRQVRRVLAYVVPDPGEVTIDAPAAGEPVPTLAQVALATAMRIPRNQSVGDQLEEIAAHNRRVAARRRRRELVATLRVGHEAVESVAVAVYPSYRAIRAERLADLILRLLAHAAEDPAEPSETWGDQLHVRRNELRDALLAGLKNLPPEQFPGPDAPVEAWFTTAGTVERAATVVLDLLRRGLGLAPPNAAVRPRLIELRGQLHALLASTRAARPRLDAGDRQELARELLAAHEEGQLETWMPTALERVLGRPQQFDSLIRRVADLLAPATELAQSAYGAASSAVQSYYEGTAELIAGLTTDGDTGAALRRLLAVEVVDVAMGDEPITEQAVELLQMSADVPNGLDGRDRASEKLAGLQLGHFGAFYKRSWRANDWLWGRLDAVERLVVVLLDPFRLRQLEVPWEQATDAIRRLALPDDDPDARAVLESLGSNERAIRDELRFLADPDAPLPAALPESAAMVSRRLQLELLRSDMPRLLEAVDEDAREDGRTVPDRWSQVQRLPPRDAVDRFTATRVGEQKIADDQGTDRFARTVAHAAAVSSAAVGGTRSGLARTRIRFGAPLRGIGLALYAITDAATRGNRVGAATVVGAAVAGAGLVGVALFVRLPPVLLLLGLALLVAGLGAAFLRRRLKWAAGALAAGAVLAVLPRALFAIAGGGESGLADTLRPYEAAWVVIALALGGVLMATVTAQRSTPTLGVSDR